MAGCPSMGSPVDRTGDQDLVPISRKPMSTMDSLSATYSHKVKTADALREILGARPRRKTVIMCHGVFDVVHPGHLRHLLYAKSKADILVASLTADHHILKGRYRPHVPQ